MIKNSINEIEKMLEKVKRDRIDNVRLLDK